MDLEAAAAALDGVDDSALARVSALIRRAELYARRIDQLESELRTVKEAHREVMEVHIPGVLAEHGMAKLVMSNGSTVSVQPYYSASIPVDRREEAHNWLRENGHGDLVKNNVTVTFGRQEDDKALDLLGSLVKRGYNVDHNAKVEPQTLKAFVKEQVEKGSPPPEDLFGVYTGQKAKITMKKAMG